MSDEIGISQTITVEKEDVIFTKHVERTYLGAKIAKEHGMSHKTATPFVYAIGTRGSGRSSTLNSIIGEEIFPTTESTMVPIRVIFKTEEDEFNKNDDDVANHLPAHWAQIGDETFHTCEEIQRAIIAKQRDILKNVGKSYSLDAQITVECHFANAPNMTLCNLPAVPKAGEENQEIISAQIKNFCKANPDANILNVCHADVDDIDADPGHILANDIEITGTRSGALTHCDVVSKEKVETHINKKRKFKFTAVINRST